MRVAETICCAPGRGVGIDISADQVEVARRSGYQADCGDVLEFEGRGVAGAAFAIDLIPELENRAAFERACLNIVRAARDFAIIQHANFDSTEALLARGLVSPGHAAKTVRLRPRAVDYLQFVMQFGSRLDIVGFAAFGFGEPRTASAPLTGLSGSLLSYAAHMPAHRSLRVIIARQATSRFRVALDRAGAGELLLLWQSG